MTGAYVNERQYFADPHAAGARAAFQTAHHIRMCGAGDPAWAKVLAEALLAGSLFIDNPTQRLLDAIGDVMPGLPRLRTLSHNITVRHLPTEAGSRGDGVIDLSTFFRGCNGCRSLRQITLTYRMTADADIALTPNPMCFITVRLAANVDHAARFWTSLPRSSVMINGDATKSIDDAWHRRMAESMRGNPPAFLGIVYKSRAFARRCAARDFLDFPIEVEITPSHDSLEDLDRTDHELRNLRALFVFAAAGTGPVGRFREKDGDCRLLAAVKNFIL